MNTETIAKKLVEYCRKGDFEGAQKDLYADDAVSIEARENGPFKKETKGLNAIFEKGNIWFSMLEKMDSCKVSEPLVANDNFAISLSMDVTMKDGQHRVFNEIALYKVENGKIISEQFFV